MTYEPLPSSDVTATAVTSYPTAASYGAAATADFQSVLTSQEETLKGLQASDLGAVITNPVVRKVLWSIFVIAGLVLGAIVAWHVSLGLTLPDWARGSMGVLGFLTVPFGTLAIANIKTSKG